MEMEWFMNQQTDDNIKVATLYKHYYGEKDSEYIEWTILKDSEDIVKDVMQAPPMDATPFGYNIRWSRYPKDVNYSNVFLTTSSHLLLGRQQYLMSTWQVQDVLATT